MQYIAGSLIVTAAAFGQMLLLQDAGALAEIGLPWLLCAAVLLGVTFYLYAHSLTIKSVLITISLGGLAMLLGLRMGSSEHLAHHLHHSANSILTSLWLIPTQMTAFMVIACLSGCLVLCRNNNYSFASLTKLHCFSCFTMVIGMLLGSFYFTALFSMWFSSTYLGHHLAMLLGMSGGVALGVLVYQRWAAKPINNPSDSLISGPVTNR